VWRLWFPHILNNNWFVFSHPNVCGRSVMVDWTCVSLFLFLILILGDLGELVCWDTDAKAIGDSFFFFLFWDRAM
jgi:hypothetical protein